MKIINEIKVCNGEVIKEYKVRNKWRANSNIFCLYDKNGRFIRRIKKKEVKPYIDYNILLIEMEKFIKWKGELNE